MAINPTMLLVLPVGRCIFVCWSHWCAGHWVKRRSWTTVYFSCHRNRNVELSWSAWIVVVIMLRDNERNVGLPWKAAVKLSRSSTWDPQLGLLRRRHEVGGNWCRRRWWCPGWLVDLLQVHHGVSIVLGFRELVVTSTVSRRRLTNTITTKRHPERIYHIVRYNAVHDLYTGPWSSYQLNVL